MSSPSPTGPTSEEITSVAHAIWEAEGRPDGRDHEHWMRARQLIEEGRAATEYPQAVPRPVQPGFEDAAPGIVPEAKADPAPELHEEAGGRFAQQLAGLPDETPDAEGSGETPSTAHTAHDPADQAADTSGEGPAQIRPAGRKTMDMPPKSWSKVDEEIDESFPASDPPGNY